MSDIKINEHGQKLCSPERPWVESDGFPAIHPNAREFGEQSDGYPGGDIIKMKCPDCGAWWKEELPQ